MLLDGEKLFLSFFSLSSGPLLTDDGLESLPICIDLKEADLGELMIAQVYFELAPLSDAAADAAFAGNGGSSLDRGESTP